MTTRFRKKTKSIKPRWISTRTIVKTTSECMCEDFLCRFPGSKITHIPANYILIDGLDDAATVALELRGGVHLLGNGAARIADLYDFSEEDELQDLLGDRVEICCVVVAYIEVEDVRTLRKIKAFTRLHENHFFDTLKRDRRRSFYS